jgi:CRP-like cAMP-binding protein
VVSPGMRAGRHAIAFRSKITEEGRRQILAFHPAGDMPDLHGLLLERMDHDLVTLSRARVAFIEHRHINELIERRPTVGRALWRETVIAASIFMEWIVSLGTRDAAGRMAHLIAEMRARLSAMGLATDDEFEFPITQSELAEALGISTVHVNRVIQSFRAAGMLNFHRSKVSLIILVFFRVLRGSSKSVSNRPSRKRQHS